MDLSTKVPLPREPGDGTCGQAPCVFCGKVIGHINDCQEVGDNCVGCVAGGIVNGVVEHFLYCNDPICPERVRAEDAGEGVKDCSCENYRAYDVLGEICHVCGKPPCEPEQAPWARPADLSDEERCPPEQSRKKPNCLWCGETLTDDYVTVDGLEVDGEEKSTEYCDADCLFHWLLAGRTDVETFLKVQEIICLPDK